MARVDGLRKIAQVAIAWVPSLGNDIISLIGARRRDRHFASKAALRDAVAERWLH